MPPNGSQPVPGNCWGFSSAGRVFFGWGVLGELRQVSAELGRRILVCTDANIVASGIAHEVERLLREGGGEVQLFTGGCSEVDLQTIGEATESARRFDPEVIVGLGGGSNLDLGKCVAILLSHPSPLSRYYGENLVPGRILDVVAVPTTSGTGSEVSPIAVVSDPDRAMKVGIASRRIIPSWAVVDPALTLSCPSHVTAHAGLDALCHAIEAFCARIPESRSPQAVFVGKNPVSDSLAREAIRLIAGSLAAAVAEPHNQVARHDMALGSLLAGLAFSNAGTATVHALQYPVGEATHTPHGLGNAVLMPAVMQAIVPSRLPEMALIARALDREMEGVTDAEAAARAPELVARLAERVGVPRGLRALGMKREQLPQMAELAYGVKRLLDNSPIAFDQSALLGILEEAY